MTYEHIWFLLTLAWIFGWAGFVILAKYLRNRSRLRVREMMHKERMLAMEKGVPLGELPDHLNGGIVEESEGTKMFVIGDWDRKIALALGLLFLFGGIGTILGLYLLPDTAVTEEAKSAASVGLIPALIGVGLLIYHRLTRSKNP